MIAALPGAARADPPHGGDAANTAAGALTVPSGTYAASLTTGDEDWYRVAVPTLSRAEVSISACQAPFLLQLYQADGTTLVMQGDCTKPVHCIANFNQVVYARVYGGVGTYTLTISQGSGLPLDGFCTL